MFSAKEYNLRTVDGHGPLRDRDCRGPCPHRRVRHNYAPEPDRDLRVRMAPSTDPFVVVDIRLIPLM